MPIDYSALLYDPVYAELGVPAVMTVAALASEITVIDDTRPKTLPVVTAATVAEVRSVGPGAFARIYELTANGIAREDYVDAAIAFNGRTWTVRSYELRGSPMGEDWGEVRFLLKERVGSDSGGGVPPWVPANAKIHIDFLGGTPQGRAWVDGIGEVAPDTLLGTDSNLGQGWWSGQDGMTADGYGGANGYAPALLGVALAAYAAGCTCRAQFCIAADGSDRTGIAWLSADGNDGIETILRLTSGANYRAYLGSYGGSLNAVILNIVNAADRALNAVAYTLSGTRAEISVNGSAAATGVITASDRPSGNPLIGVVVQLGGHYVQSLTLYDPLPSTAGLSDLSAIE